MTSREDWEKGRRSCLKGRLGEIESASDELDVVLASAHPLQQSQDKLQNKTTKPTPEQLQNSCCLLFPVDPFKQHIALLGTERLIWNWKTVKNPWWVVSYRHYAYDLRLKPITWGGDGRIAQKVWLLSGFLQSILGFFWGWCCHHGPFSPRPNGCSAQLGASYEELRLGGISLQINFPEEGPETHKHQASSWRRISESWAITFCASQLLPKLRITLPCYNVGVIAVNLQRWRDQPSPQVFTCVWINGKFQQSTRTSRIYRFYCLNRAPHAWHIYFE